MCMQAILFFFAGQSLVKIQACDQLLHPSMPLFKLSHSLCWNTPCTGHANFLLSQKEPNKKKKEHVHLTVTHLFKSVTLLLCSAERQTTGKPVGMCCLLHRSRCRIAWGAKIALAISVALKIGWTMRRTNLVFTENYRWGDQWYSTHIQYFQVWPSVSTADIILLGWLWILLNKVFFC